MGNGDTSSSLFGSPSIPGIPGLEASIEDEETFLYGDDTKKDNRLSGQYNVEKVPNAQGLHGILKNSSSNYQQRTDIDKDITGFINPEGPPSSEQMGGVYDKHPVDSQRPSFDNITPHVSQPNFPISGSGTSKEFQDSFNNVLNLLKIHQAGSPVNSANQEYSQSASPDTRPRNQPSIQDMMVSYIHDCYCYSFFFLVFRNIYYSIIAISRTLLRRTYWIRCNHPRITKCVGLFHYMSFFNSKSTTYVVSYVFVPLTFSNESENLFFLVHAV